MRVNLAVRVFNPIDAHDMVECGNHTTSSTQIYILKIGKVCTHNTLHNRKTNHKFILFSTV